MSGDEVDDAEWAGVEFIDPDESGAERAEGAESAEVLWLDEEGVGSGRTPDLLPPPTTRGRLLVSLLAVALFLAGSGSAVAAAYHRHATDRRIAEELVLRPAPTLPSIPGLASLGFTVGWHAHVTERVLVPVVNRSPRPVQLLGAVLTEPGLVAAAKLTPVDARQLQPGATGELGGTVTVDCTVSTSVVAVSILSFDGNTVTNVATAQLQVSARTADGSTGIAVLNPESTSVGMQERICGQEGNALTRTDTLSTVADPHARTITVQMSTVSNADVPMDYTASALYSADPDYEVSGLAVSQPAPQNAVAGSVAVGAKLAVTFVIDVWSCPKKPLPNTDLLQLQVGYSIHGTTLETSHEGIGLDGLIATACGSTVAG